MAYLVFDGEDGPVLIELSQQEVQEPSDGIVKAGIGERMKDNLAKAQQTFNNALVTLIQSSAEPFVKAAKSMADAPNQIEVEFGIKATGEVGNLAIGKLTGDANYRVKLTWTKPS